jgi:hypothetical protein
MSKCFLEVKTADSQTEPESPKEHISEIFSNNATDEDYYYFSSSNYYGDTII